MELTRREFTALGGLAVLGAGLPGIKSLEAKPEEPEYRDFSSVFELEGQFCSLGVRDKTHPGYPAYTLEVVFAIAGAKIEAKQRNRIIRDKAGRITHTIEGQVEGRFRFDQILGGRVSGSRLLRLFDNTDIEGLDARFQCRIATPDGHEQRILLYFRGMRLDYVSHQDRSVQPISPGAWYGTGLPSLLSLAGTLESYDCSITRTLPHQQVQPGEVQGVMLPVPDLKFWPVAILNVC